MVSGRINVSRLISIFIVLTAMAGCASNPKSANDNGGISLEHTNVDKYESFNRKVFAFNQKLDSWILKPAAKGYRWIAPEPVEVGISNFFKNLGEINNVVNDILQWKWKSAGNDGGRFVINSTLGILGFFDVAKHTGLERSDGEDFGQTLAVWGVPQGPYLMLPVLGPTTVTAGVGLPVDWYFDPTNKVTPRTDRYALMMTNWTQRRAGYLDVEDLASGDLYIFLRDTYLQHRNFLVKDGAVEDEFGGDDFGDDF